MTGHRLIPFEGDLEPGEDYEGLRFAAATFDDAAAGGCHFLGCSFVRTSFEGGRLRKSRFTDVSLREVRFVATDLAETGWQDTTLDGYRLVVRRQPTCRVGIGRVARQQSCLAAAAAEVHLAQHAATARVRHPVGPAEAVERLRFRPDLSERILADILEPHAGDLACRRAGENVADWVHG